VNTSTEELVAVVAAQTIDLFRLREQVRQMAAEIDRLRLPERLAAPAPTVPAGLDQC
jgi:hypothetical protein